jgi:hypothetical protein
MFRNFVWRIPAILILIAIVSGLCYLQPWEKEVWITTTPDAFVVPAIGRGQAEEMVDKLGVGITPAPWPKEAGKILRAAKRGRIVHVTLVSKNATDRFDISGVSPAGNLLIDVKSMIDVKRVSSLLLYGDAGKDSNR